MAITNNERVGKALDLLREGLAPFVEREVQAKLPSEALQKESLKKLVEDPPLINRPIAEWDAGALLKLMSETWQQVFRSVLGHAERSLVSELRDWRNKWAHQHAFSSDDADRALDSVERLLSAISAPQADEVRRMKLELRRLVYEEQVRSEKRKAGGSLVEAAAKGVLKPWREIVTPHPDIASGRYQQAEFAADLWQVYLGEGSDEYRAPKEFFRRTYLTESLKRLLIGAVKRLSGQGGDPVVQLQTNFGGGKTHSMLALYHLFGDVKPTELAGMETVMAKAGVTQLPRVRRVVLVGNRISPGNPITKPDGTLVRTLWGELAWQLGGKEAYARIAQDDEHATNPGDALRELFKAYGPCLILIDEWVAYARQLHDTADLPGGSFETQFSFAQALTESVKLAGNCLLVISLPAADTADSPHAQAKDEEVGGLRGREALHRLRNVIGRLESSWRPASAEESFEIVRRRLFEPLSSPEAFKQRDVTARAFADFYRAHPTEFPPQCQSTDYENRIKAAFPIHPEVFDRLYEDWSALVHFQRTRGVLRLMAAVIHYLWEKGDRNPLILPSTLPIDDPQVQAEFTRYLSADWVSIIEKDVDGPNSLPVKIDRQVPNLGRVHATRRVARTIFLGSAPTTKAAHHGLEEQRIKLGCAMPGESLAVFGDALRRLRDEATYLYQDGPRFWYSTQPTVTKLAEERAEQLKRNPDKGAAELEARVRADLKNLGDFSRVHILPRSGADILDDYDSGTRLVVLPPDQPYSKEPNNPAEIAARAILEWRGDMPRQYRNTLVFLAADKMRLQDLDEAVRKYLAWSSILAEKDRLNLPPSEVKQAETRKQAAEVTITKRLAETYQWVLVPEQKSPEAAIEWRALRLIGSEPLAVRASKKLKSEDLLVASLGSTILRKYLDEVPLWRGDRVAVRQLIEDFASYLYLPRLASPRVLLKALNDGVALLTWQTDSFAYAERYDEQSQRYLGLRAGQRVSLEPDDRGLIVKPEVAKRQMESEVPTSVSAESGVAKPEAPLPGRADSGPGPVSKIPQPPRRFHGTVRLTPERVGRDAARIAEEVIAHLLGQPGAKVVVTLEIEAHLPNGASEQIIRTVNENSQTLQFTNYGFERE